MDSGTIIRTTVLLFALLNQILAAYGQSPLPFTEAQIEEAVSVIITVAASIWAWWKNNYVSQKGKRQEVTLRKAGLK